jgi:hypothetical protein
VLNLRETLLGSFNQQQNRSTIRIGRWVLLIVHVAQIPLAERIGGLLTQGVKAPRYRRTSVQQKANQGRGRRRCEAGNCGRHDRLLEPS